MEAHNLVMMDYAIFLNLFDSKISIVGTGTVFKRYDLTQIATETNSTVFLHNITKVLSD